MDAHKDNPLSRQRLRRRDLVMSILSLFEEEYEKSEVEPIWELKLSMESVKEFLKERYHISYRSDQWVYTQLRRYEDELGVKLFRRESKGGRQGSFLLSIHDRMETFYQKQHLYITQKIKVANGVYEKIKNDLRERRITRPALVFLGAGSTLYHIANIFAEKSWQDSGAFRLYTHNLGSLRRLLESNVNYAALEVHTPGGRFDPVTFTVFGREMESYQEIPFDFLIEGTTYLYDQKLYVDSPDEMKIKEMILHRFQGEKILVLTKNELTDQPLQGLESYGKLTDFDWVVVPRGNPRPEVLKKHDRLFALYQALFVPEILHWNYVILRVDKKAALKGDTRRKAPAG